MTPARTALLGALLRRHPQDAAPVLEKHRAAETAAFLETAPPEAAAAALASLSPPYGSAVVRAWTPDVAARLLSLLPPPVAAGILRRCRAADRRRLLGELSPARSDAIRNLLAYERGSIGAVMDLAAPVLPADRSVADALAGWPPDATTLYVVTRDQILLGAVPVSRLVGAAGETSLDALSIRTVPRLAPSMPASTAEDHPAWAEFDQLPVVDADGRFLGAIHHRSLRHVRRTTPAHTTDGLDALLSVGEVLWLGLYGVLEGVATRREPAPSPAPEEDTNA